MSDWRRASVLPFVAICLLLISGCSRRWEEKPYDRIDGASMDLRSEELLRSFMSETGSIPEDVREGTGRVSKQGMMLVFRLEAVDDESNLLEEKGLKLLHPPLTPVADPGSVPRPAMSELQGVEVREFGFCQLPVDYLIGMKVGGVKLFRNAGKVRFRSFNEAEDIFIGEARTMKEGREACEKPSIRVTLLSAGEADLRLCHWKHIAWDGSGIIPVPKGFVTESWYELRKTE